MPKSKANRTSEPEIAIAALMVARDRPGGRVSTSHLKKMIPDYIKLTDDDWEESSTRKGEALWQQIVGNIISHRTTEGNIIAEGYATYTGKGIEITEAGRAYLQQLRR
jgi:hypothetical protein